MADTKVSATSRMNLSCVHHVIKRDSIGVFLRDFLAAHNGSIGVNTAVI